MYFPYDESSYYGDVYYDEINAVHPDYPRDIKRYLSTAMELDKALANLLDKLEQNGQLEKTVLCLYADHRPYWLNESLVKEITSQYVDRSMTYGYHKTPFIIYNSELEGQKFDMLCSTLDNLPTIANMFNLNYDPRLYVGVDIYSEDATVIDANRNWFDKDG